MSGSANPSPSPHAWDADALLAKARRYVDEMQSHDHADWQFAFWSSLALELIARASLAKTSRALLADTSNGNVDWGQIYFALGHTPTSQKFNPKSIPISEVLNRIQAINSEFDKELRDFCSIHTGMRNAELHSADMPFEDLQASAWLWKFYRSCEILITVLGINLESLVGPEESAFAKTQMAAAKDEAAKVVLGTIKSFKEVWQSKPTKEKEKSIEKASSWALRQHGHIVVCPACASEALLDGDPISPPKKTLKEDMVVETQSKAPSRLQCIACGLKINGLSQLSAAGLGSPFKTTATFDAAEYFYPDDDNEWQYDDDNNE